MKSATFFIAAISALSFVAASSPHDTSMVSRHRRLGRSGSSLDPATRNLTRRRDSKRCKPREEPKPNTGNVDVNAGNNNNNNGGGKGGENSHGDDTVSVPSLGLIKLTTSSCGAPGASKETSATGGPNGAQWWLNCGIDDGGWNPPMVTMDDIVTVDLKNAGSTFDPCKDFVWIFEKYGNEYNIPPIMLASFAMQESTCNPATIGGGGEQGLMQITQEKCGGAPNGNCLDPEFNIKTGAKFFKTVLDQNDGNVLKAAGHYNGWFEKMTKGDAMAAASSSCCLCQQNLDYLHQFFNGWLQGKDAYSNTLRLGSYFNLDKCRA